MTEVGGFEPHMVDAVPASLRVLLDAADSEAVPPATELVALQDELKELVTRTQARAAAFERDAHRLVTQYKHLWMEVPEDAEKLRQQHVLEEHKALLAKQELETTRSAGKVPSHHLAGENDKSDASSETSTGKEGGIVFQAEPSTAEEDEMKRRLAVAHYPRHDLAHLLPGTPPSEDFSRSKPSNQVATATFFSSIQPFFQTFSEDDLGFLRDRSAQYATQTVPVLGPFYREVWAEEDDLGSHFRHSPVPRNSAALSSILSRGSVDVLTDTALETDEVSCGPLSSRILCTLICEDRPAEEDSKPDDTEKAEEQASSNQSWRVPASKADFATLEERLKRELKYIGLFPDGEEPNWNYRADDEVAAHLRYLQAKLKKQAIVNTARKQIIAELTREQLAYQEYATIQEDLDKQVEQAYMKRSRTLKAKKKRIVGQSGAGTDKANIGEYMRTLLERRRKWIDKVGPVFAPVEQYTRIPTETIFSPECMQKIQDELADE